jgi:hypothetical protein
MLRPLDHDVFHQGTGRKGQIQICQRAIQGHLKVAQGVDHRTVKVNDGGLQEWTGKVHKLEIRKPEKN